MKLKIRMISVFFALVLLSANSSAMDLVVGVENIEYYPIYTVEKGEYRGYARELLDEFAKKYGHTITYKPLPIKRLFNDFVNGKFDLKFPDNSYWAGDLKKGKNVTYSDPALEYIDGSLVLPANSGKGKEQVKRLGIVRGFTPWEYLGDIKSGKVKTQESTKISQLMQSAEAGRVDAVYFNVQVARYFLNHSKEFSENLVEFDDSLPHTRSHYHLSSIKHPEVIAQFNEFMKHEAALVDSLRKKYEVNL